MKPADAVIVGVADEERVDRWDVERDAHGRVTWYIDDSGRAGDVEHLTVMDRPQFASRADP